MKVQNISFFLEFQPVQYLVVLTGLICGVNGHLGLKMLFVITEFQYNNKMIQMVSNLFEKIELKITFFN